MIRNLLATTAIATLVATGAFAQSTTPSPSPTAPAAAPEAPRVIKAEGNLASNIIGATVYNGTGDDAENIGEVNDIVLSPEGDIQAIVVGVGGFLGIGQKNVALEYSVVEWTERDGERYLVVETTEEALRAQQEFERQAYEPMPADAQVTEVKPATKEDLDNAPVEAEAEGDQPAGDTAMAPAGDAAAPADGAADTGSGEMAATDEPAEQPADQAAEAPATDAEQPTDQAAEAPATDGGQPATEQTAQTGTDTTAEEPSDQAAEAQGTDTGTTAAIDRSSLQPLDTAEITAEEFIGTTVYGANDEQVGEIGDVVMDGDKVDAVIIDVGGFLGMGEKQIAVALDNLEFMTDGDGNRYLYTDWTQEQLEAQPEYDEASWAENRDEMRMVVPN